MKNVISISCPSVVYTLLYKRTEVYYYTHYMYMYAIKALRYSAIVLLCRFSSICTYSGRINGAIRGRGDGDAGEGKGFN